MTLNKSWPWLLCVYAFAIVLQYFLFIHGDVSWGISASRQLLGGASYVKDIFDVSPPLMLFHYVPPVLIAKIFSFNDVLSLKIYIFFLSSISLIFCYFFIKQIFEKSESLVANVFFLTLAMVLLIFPLGDFAQKEHLLLIFTLPYLLLLTARLQGKVFSFGLALLIGLFAGLGFAIKPYFLMAFVLVETYFFFSTRNFLLWQRGEIVGIFSFLILYSIVVFTFFSDYLFVAGPLFVRFFYDGIAYPWYVLIFYPVTIYCCFAILLYVFQFHQTRFKPLHTILCLALMGFLFAYLVQRTTWSYRLLPSLSIAILMLVLSAGKSRNYILIFFIGCLIFPVAYLLHEFNKKIDSQNDKRDLIQYMKTYAENKPVYFFTTEVGLAFPAIYYANAWSASRFAAFLIMLPGLLKESPVPIRERDFFIDMVAEDITKNKPYLIFVDSREFQTRLEERNFDYVKYFSQDPKFQTAWKNYRYVTTIEKYHPVSFEKVKLYKMLKADEINPSVIKGRAVILTGMSNPKVAYFVKDGNLFHVRDHLMTAKVFFTDTEKKIWEQQSVGIQKNDLMINHDIIKKSLLAVNQPVYRFYVFRRTNGR